MIKPVLIASICTVLSTTLSLSLIFRHLIHYQQPQYQIHVVRLIWIVPLYSFEALLSLLFPEWEMILATLRDSYEAYVLYTFMSLCIAYVGGEEKLLGVLEQKKKIKQPWPLHNMKPLTTDAAFLRRVKQGVLQFVFVKPAMASIAVLLNSYGVYDEGEINFRKGFVYISFVTYWAVTLSLYCLFLFYLSICDALKDWNPWPKFLCIKSVVFFSYWQTVTLVILVKIGIMQASYALIFQNSLICVEMFFAAIAFELAFPAADYNLEIDHKPPLLKSIKEVVSVHKEVLRDARNTFLRDAQGQVEMSRYERIATEDPADGDITEFAERDSLTLSYERERETSLSLSPQKEKERDLPKEREREREGDLELVDESAPWTLPKKEIPQYHYDLGDGDSEEREREDKERESASSSKERERDPAAEALAAAFEFATNNNDQISNEVSNHLIVAKDDNYDAQILGANATIINNHVPGPFDDPFSPDFVTADRQQTEEKLNDEGFDII